MPITTTNTSTEIWTGWNQIITTSTTSGSSNQLVWRLWNGGFTSNGTATLTVTSSSTDIWRSWNHPIWLPAQRTPEQIAEDARQAEIRERQHAEERARRAAAEERAEKLLRMSLSRRQTDELDQRGAFTLEAHSPDGAVRLYEIARGRSKNVYELDTEGKRKHCFCIHPNVMCPDADTMLAQKLMLEANEKEFRRVANQHW